MRFGSSTMFLREQPVTAALDLIAHTGFAAAEVWIEHIWHSGETIEEIRQRAEALGLVLSVHAATYDINICSSNSGIQRESRRQVVESLQIAAQLGAHIVTVHPGRYSSSRDADGAYWDTLVEAVAQFDETAAYYGLRLGIEGMENRPREFFVRPNDFQRLFDHPWKTIGLTIDIAHAQTVMNPLEYLDRISAPQIAHVHCSDNSQEHTHLPLGSGTLDLPNALAALRRKYDGWVSLEGYVPGQGEKIVRENAAYLHSLGLM